MMKKMYLVMSFLLVTILASAQNVNIPDANFKAYLVGNSAINTNGDGEIQVTEANNFLGEIDCSNQSISDLTGIEEFTNLTVLSCAANPLSSIDLTQNIALTTLFCISTSLTSIDLTQNVVLEDLQISSINLSSLNVTQNVLLKKLYCIGCPMYGGIDVSQNILLEELLCSSVPMTSIDVSQNIALTRLECGSTNITNLDVSQNVALEQLNIAMNNLNSIDLSQNGALTHLDCRNNNLTILDLSLNLSLVRLTCTDNSLINLDLSQNIQLTQIYCNNNNLVTLIPPSGSALAYLFCSNNNLTSLDVSGMFLARLDCSNNQLTCLNIKSINTLVMALFGATNNPSLTCVEVDDVGIAVARWGGSLDPGVSFSTNCGNACSSVNPLETYVPDDNFETYLETHDANGVVVTIGDPSSMGNGIALDDYVTTASISGVTDLDVAQLGISDMTGIEDFAALTILSCYNNSLGSLDVTQNMALTNLTVFGNLLTSLDLSQNSQLISLSVSNNSLNSLDLSQNNLLWSLNFGNNNVSTIDVTQLMSLEVLNCYGNPLSNIDVTQNIPLRIFRPYSTNISSVDVSQNINLEELDCRNNVLGSLDLRYNTSLYVFYGMNCGLNSLNVKNGNNLNMAQFHSSNNPNLSCIEVDDVAYSTINWTNIDPASNFSNDCSVVPCSASYELSDVSATCSNSTFCVPLVATTAITSGLMGVDFTLDYDPAIMTPTGNVTLGSVATAYGASGINTSTSGKVVVTVYLNGAPGGTFLNGAGEIACVEFTVNAGVTSGTSATISVDGSVLEGIAGNPTCPATPSTFTFEDDNMLSGYVRYRNKNGRPLLYDAASPSTYLITDITGVDGACATPSASIAPDVSGDFTYDATNGTSLQFERDINGDFSVPNVDCGDVMAVINTTDRNQALDIVTSNNATPTVYQLLSADVNLDGMVSSQDVSMITSRTINDNYCEFNQGNYVWDAGSTSYIPTATYSKSKDWLFIDATTLNSAAFTTGMSKNNVPQVPDCLPINTVNNGTCNTIPAENYEAILLGDVNGNWNTANAADAKAGEPFTLVFDIDNAVLNGNGNYELPISYIANTGVTAVDGIDFSMDFDGTAINVINTTIDAALPTVLHQWQNHSNELLMFTAFDNNTISTTGTVATIEIQSSNGTITIQDLGEINAYVNGDPAGVEVRGINITTGIENSEANAINLTVYPNPNNGEMLFVSSANSTTIDQVIVTSITGKEMINRRINTTKNKIEIPLQNIAKGVYFVTVVTENNTKTEKLIIQ